MTTIALNLTAPQDPAQRDAMIQAGLLNSDGSPRPITVDLSNNSGGVFDTGGRRLLAPISPGDVNEAAELPSVLHGYVNGAYRADEAATVGPVAKRQFKARKMALANMFQRVNTKIAESTAVPELDVGTSVTEHEVDDYAVGSFVNLATEANEGSTPFRLRAAAARMCANKVLLDREYLFWAAAVTSGNWNASNVQTLNGSTKWNGGASADVVGNLRTMMSSSAAPITDIFMNEVVAGDMLKDAGFREHMRQMLGDSAPAPSVANMLGQIDRGSPYDFIVPGFPAFRVVTGKYTSTSAETATLTALLDNHVVGVRRLPSLPASGEDVSTITTYNWTGVSGTGWTTREFDVSDRGVFGGRMVVAVKSYKDVFTANRIGGLILNAHA
jgi:hypothetical protein